jgi:hypothetical protein
MKKVLLSLFLLAFAGFAFGQVNLYENFNESMPSNWTTIDGGSNDATWYYEEGGYGMNGTNEMSIETYPGPASDHLISPQITVNSGDKMSFYASCTDSQYRDNLHILVSTTGNTAGDFTDTLDYIDELPTSFTKFEYDLNAYAGQQVYIAFYTDSEGEYINFDNFKVAQPGTYLFMNAFSKSDDAIDFVLDDSASSVTAADYKLTGTETITFGSVSLDSDNKTIVHLSNASAAMAGDNIVDTLINTVIEDTILLYAGIVPVSYTNAANPAGTVNQANSATYTGKVTASDGDNELIVADASGAYNGVHLYGVTASDYSLGDSIKFYGILSPYYGQTELYNPTIIESYTSAQGPYPATFITPADIDTSITQDTNPAEQYENVLVTIENVVIDSYDPGTGYFYATDGSDVFRIGSDAVNLFNGTFDASVLQVGSTYDVSGVVAGMDGEYHVVPRHINDMQILQDNTAPVVSTSATTISNASGNTVPVQSNEASGDVYIILDGEPQSSIAELETAVSNNKGSKAAVTAANTDISVSTFDLVPGDYYAYATDSADNLSSKGTNAVTVTDSSDEVPPVITYTAQTVTNSDVDSVTLQSNEGGKVYIVKDGVMTDTTASVLDSLVGEYQAAMAVAIAGTDVKVGTKDIEAGVYYGFAVDGAGNVSEPGDAQITVNSSGMAIPYVENFADSAAISSYGMTSVDADEDGFNWYVATYQDEIYVESQSYDSDAGPLTPENYLISPKIDLRDASNAELRWFDLTLDPDYEAEHYEVIISTTTNDTTAFTEENVVFERTMTSADATDWNERSVNLSNYIGHEIYIAWVHNECTDNYKIAVDSIKVYAPDVTAPEVYAAAQTVEIGEDVYVQSSEATGKVYIILDSEPQSSVSDLESAVNIGTAASADVTAADTDIAISTSGLSEGTYYAYAVDDAGNMSAKSDNAITLEDAGGPQGIDDEAFAEINIYPNPANQILYFNSDTKVSNVVIYNSLGQKVVNQKINSDNLIDVSGLSQGIYFIRFKNVEKVLKTDSFIKQ